MEPTNADHHIKRLKAWNSRQELRQKNMTQYREPLKAALKRSMCCELHFTKLWSAAMLFNN